MMSDAREEAIQRMVEDAEKKGANAVVGMKETSYKFYEESFES